MIIKTKNNQENLAQSMGTLCSIDDDNHFSKGMVAELLQTYPLPHELGSDDEE